MVQRITDRPHGRPLSWKELLGFMAVALFCAYVMAFAQPQAAEPIDDEPPVMYRFLDVPAPTAP